MEEVTGVVHFLGQKVVQSIIVAIAVLLLSRLGSIAVSE
jgi:hypothetical protein